jgi:hypothetical protein
MSLAENLNEAQRLNLIVMQKLENNFDPIVFKESSEIFTSLIYGQIIYLHDSINCIEIEINNEEILRLLCDGEITAQEAAIQSNSLWIDFINRLRAPNTPKLNISSLPKLNVYNFI